MLISPSIPAVWFWPGCTKYNLYKLASGALSEALNDLNSVSSEGSKSKPVGTSINNANDSETSTV